MKYELKHNLGMSDAVILNEKYGARLSLKVEDLLAGKVIDLPDSAAEYLTKHRGYIYLLDTPGNVTGEAKKPALTAPAK